MENTIREYGKEFYSSSGLTPEFDTFRKLFKKEITKLLKKLGATDIKVSYGHYEISGYFTYKEKAWYFNSGDVRLKCFNSMLLRRVKNYEDCTGYINQWVPFTSQFEEVLSQKINF